MANTSSSQEVLRGSEGCATMRSWSFHERLLSELSRCRDGVTYQRYLAHNGWKRLA